MIFFRIFIVIFIAIMVLFVYGALIVSSREEQNQQRFRAKKFDETSKDASKEPTNENERTRD